MRGIVYKDLCLFFKGIDKWLLLVLGGLLVLFVVQGGVHAGMLVSFALDMLVGVMHVGALEKEEETAWGDYQRTLPVGAGEVVAGKYAAVLLTVLAGVAGAVVCDLAAFAVYRTFLPEVLKLSVLLAAAIPLIWTALGLPFSYWFGSRVAQYTSMPLAFLLFFSLRDLEDGRWAVADLTFLSENFAPVLLIGLLALAGLFLASLALSAAGYCRRR
ncbi:ABC-2 transporter permease [uncultured Oscillibacter sp.]|uniref:ABC-2 transporter permease n=1 Tax=uncultured Oscillibacter sp. TaxID=876091 RepID=UPI0025D51D9E|nr:ABC-2 transporter permease [uncultured Oscillibacter sp.]